MLILIDLVLSHSESTISSLISQLSHLFCIICYCIGGVMVSVLALSAVGHGLEPQLG
jgi:hypothetical protein